MLLEWFCHTSGFRVRHAAGHSRGFCRQCVESKHSCASACIIFWVMCAFKDISLHEDVIKLLCSRIDETVGTLSTVIVGHRCSCMHRAEHASRPSILQRVVQLVLLFCMLP